MYLTFTQDQHKLRCDATRCGPTNLIPQRQQVIPHEDRVARETDALYMILVSSWLAHRIFRATHKSSYATVKRRTVSWRQRCRGSINLQLLLFLNGLLPVDTPIHSCS